MLLVVHILRSHECISTTYHRLIFGLSAVDIISSPGFILSSTMVPKELNYLVPFASGNIATCDARGFLIVLAVGVPVRLQLICLLLLFGNHYKQQEVWLHSEEVGTLVSWRIYYITIGNQWHTFGNECTQRAKWRDLLSRIALPTAMHWIRSVRNSIRV
jgi:hypothetical protein